MPNEADHSVKITHPDRNESVKEYVILVGTLVAAVGALATLFSGTPVGTAIGAGLLTTLIILQIFLRFEVKRTRTHADRVTAQSATAHLVSNSNSWLGDMPVLMLNVSRFGRVRAISGREDFLPGLRVGLEIDRFLGSDTNTIERKASGAGLLSIIRSPISDGQLIILIPETAVNQLADQALLERTHFFAGLGHDLKSPLNAVIGFADIMDTELLGPMPDAYKEYPGLILDGGQTLLRLVEDMLAYAKSDAGTYELDIAELDVAASAESVMRQSQGIAQKAGIRLRLTARQDVVALADAEAVRRIWDNLVSNAIKYSASGDTVTLSAIDQGAHVLLRVSDVGAGMDADDLARIARPFAQGRNSRGRSGSGLGLATVQRLAQMQNGQVEIRTAPGAGTTVTVRLPGLTNSEKRAAE